jgi:hypothetical protein
MASTHITEVAEGGSSQHRNVTVLAFLGCWFAFCTVVFGALSMTHIVAFPEPEDDKLDSVLSELWALREGSEGDYVVHVIARDCSCTESLFRHLTDYGPAPHTEEVVLFVGNDAAKEAAARQAGYEFVSISRNALSDIGLESAPILAVFDELGTIRYLGGYYDHPAASQPLDQRLRRSIKSGQSPDPLPIYGCAVSQRLRDEFDPYGIVYRGE